jgi:predicted nucleotidyltransferase component of viral defense system
MISRAAIDQRVREWGLRHEVVEKDYVLGWLPWGIGNDSVLDTTWIFKGGTCLKKCSRLNPHNDKWGYPCSGRAGYLVDTRW